MRGPPASRPWPVRPRGVTGTADAARDGAGQLVADGRAEAARVERAALVVGTTLSYDYCPTGQAWAARLEAGRFTWTPAPGLPGRADR